MTSELKPVNSGGLMSSDESNCWVLANQEQVNIWNWFVALPDVQYRTVSKLSRQIGNNLVSINRVIGKPYDSIISYSDVNTGKKYKLAPISLKYLLVTKPKQQDCFCPCKPKYSTNTIS